MTDMKVFPPSKYIKEALEGRGWNQTDLALILGRGAKFVSDLVTDKKRVDPEIAQELAVVFNTTPQYWLELENTFRLAQTDYVDEAIEKRTKLLTNYPIKEMQKRGWISQTEKLEELEPELKKFFEKDDLEKDVELRVSYKRTGKEANANAAEKAWLYRAKHLARMLPVAVFDINTIDKLIAHLRKLAAKSGAVVRVAEALANYGIRFVVVEPLPRAKIDGAAFWLDENSPVIAMSLRFNNIGNFWFTLMHELSHIKHRDAFSLDDLEASPSDETEIRANKEAANALVPEERLEKFIKMYSPYYSEARINNLATQLNIHPGIIVGQLQYRKEVAYNTHTKIMPKVRELATTSAFTDGWGHPIPQVRY
ncbi:MAG: helix-turn-helix domain-containing protein [Pyrinomonadaceae bacterium]|nr:helix-turn-helix domain-containing protein [Pyrinomonadaceae bacterium]